MNAGTLTRTVAALVALGMGVAVAQTEEHTEKRQELEIGKWHPDLELGFQFAQSAFTDNWNGGDTGTFTWIAQLEAGAERRFGPHWYWGNSLRAMYGQTGDQVDNEDGTRSWTSPRKSTDRLDAETILAYVAKWKVDPFVAVRFATQFQDQNDPTRFINFNPLVFKETIGLARRFIQQENRNLTGRLSLGFRQMSRKQFLEPAPSDASTRATSNDGGLDLTFDWMTPLSERIKYEGKLIVYQPFFYSGKEELERITTADRMEFGIPDDVADYGLVADVSFENRFTSQLTKIIAVNLFLHLVYDKYDNSVAPLYDMDGNLLNGPVVEQAVRKSGQFKQVLSFGLQHQFF